MDVEQYKLLKRTVTPYKIEIILCVAELRSLTRASEKLGLSAPRISHTISRIENATGVDIFAKRAQTFKLSEDGEMLLEYLQRVLDVFSEADPESTND